ncbi:MAG: hypothetical protein AAGF04_05105 [Chlamydiota bacterium]
MERFFGPFFPRKESSLQGKPDIDWVDTAEEAYLFPRSWEKSQAEKE